MAPGWPSPAVLMTTPAMCPHYRPASGTPPRVGVVLGLLAGITECGIPAMSLTETNGLTPAGCTRLRPRSRPTCARWAHAPSTRLRHIRRPAAKSNGLADVEEMAARPPTPATLDDLTRCWRHFALYNHHDHTGRCAGPHPPNAFTATEKARPAERRWTHGFRYPPRCRKKCGQRNPSRPTVTTGLRWLSHDCAHGG